MTGQLPVSADMSALKNIKQEFQSPRRRARVEGMTLVELLVGMVVMTIVLGALGGVMYTTVQATQDTKQTRSRAVRSTALQAQLVEGVHESLSFLLAASNRLLLWTSDGNASDGVNLDELRLFERDARTQQLFEYHIIWPASMTQAQIDAANTAYASTSNFATVANRLKRNANCRKTLVAAGLKTMTATLNKPAALDATLVTLKLETIMGSLSETCVAACGPREPRRPA